MNKIITLEDNLEKLNRVAMEIKRLTKPELYYNSPYKAMVKCDKANRRHLKLALKSLKKLMKAIDKQTKERIHLIRFGVYKVSATN